MNFRQYQAAARKTAQYPQLGANTVYPALGLAGEAGEVAEKIKKAWRVSEKLDGFDSMGFEGFESLVKEMGDVLWYLAALSSELGISLEYVAEQNIKKLADRAERGTIKGEGDKR